MNHNPHSRSRRLVSAGGSALVLLALVVGVPVLLWRLAGWPLPDQLPTPNEIGRGLSRSDVPDSAVVAAIALVGWAAWLTLLWSILTEVSSAIRGRPAHRIRLAGPFQNLARQLVTSISLLAVTGMSSPMASAATAVTPDHAMALVRQPVVAAAVISPTTPEPGQPTSAPTATFTSAVRETATYVVQRRDSLWKIAECELGDPLRWREVWDLNRNRNFDGAIFADPNLIYPGWTLDLPSSANGAPAALGAAPRQADQPPASVVDPPAAADSLPPQPESEGETNTDNSNAPSATSTTVAASENQPSSPARETPMAPAIEDRNNAKIDAASEGSNGLVAPIAVAVGALSSIALAVGLKGLLDRRRRRFSNGHDGAPAGRTPSDQRDLHHAVVAQADQDRIDDLQAVLGSLALSLAATHSARRPQVVRHGADSIEVLLDQPDSEPPDGWTASDDGTVWTLVDRPHSGDGLDAVMCPAPLLVTIGEPEDEAQLYLDFEVDGLLALAGDQTVATNLARSIVTELALTPLAETLRVIAVGNLVDPDADVLEHLAVVDAWDDIAEDVLAWIDQSNEAMAENGWPNAFVARAEEPDHDALVPVAVIADRPPPVALEAALRNCRPTTVAVVVVGGFDGAVDTIRCEPNALNLDSIDLSCTPQTLDDGELADMCRLLAATEDAEAEQLADAPPANYGTEASSNGSGRSSELDAAASVPESDLLEVAVPPAYEVLVRFLGDISIEGGEALKPKAAAVVSYVALHRSVSTERLEGACWFGSDGSSHRKRLRDVMTEGRAALGAQHLPSNRKGAYVVGPRVRTDLELFDWHVRQAARLDPTDALGHYRAALALVTGRPFSYPNAARASYGWVDFEHHATTWEYRLTQVAQACAEMYLDGGDPGEAITMLRGLLQAIPMSGAVVEALMRAHIANGHCTGAKRVYQEHTAALEQARLGEPEDSLAQLLLDYETSE